MRINPITFSYASSARNTLNNRAANNSAGMRAQGQSKVQNQGQNITFGYFRTEKDDDKFYWMVLNTIDGKDKKVPPSLKTLETCTAAKTSHYLEISFPEDEEGEDGFIVTIHPKEIKEKYKDEVREYAKQYGYYKRNPKTGKKVKSLRWENSKSDLKELRRFAEYTEDKHDRYNLQ